jgi:hypothetical protein
MAVLQLSCLVVLNDIVHTPRRPYDCGCIRSVSIFDTFEAAASGSCTMRLQQPRQLLQLPNEQSIRGATLDNYYPSFSNLNESQFRVACARRFVR